MTTIFGNAKIRMVIKIDSSNIDVIKINVFMLITFFSVLVFGGSENMAAE